MKVTDRSITNNDYPLDKADEIVDTILTTRQNFPAGVATGRRCLVTGQLVSAFTARTGSQLTQRTWRAWALVANLEGNENNSLKMYQDDNKQDDSKLLYHFYGWFIRR